MCNFLYNWVNIRPQDTFQNLATQKLSYNKYKEHF